MPIVYTKLFELLKEKGYTTYKIRQEKLIGQGTLTAIKNGTGGLDAKTIARLCEVLDCQPGDILVYVKDPEDVENAIVVEDDMPSASSINDKKPSNLDSKKRVTA